MSSSFWLSALPSWLMQLHSLDLDLFSSCYLHHNLLLIDLEPIGCSLHRIKAPGPLHLLVQQKRSVESRLVVFLRCKNLFVGGYHVTYQLYSD